MYVKSIFNVFEQFQDVFSELLSVIVRISDLTVWPTKNVQGAEKPALLLQIVKILIR